MKKQEEVTGATEKLRTLGSLKGKISNKVATITKEHKFFTDNVTCPTCTQPIEEEFRINKIEDAQNRAKELQSGFKELEDTKNEEERERHFTKLSKEITTLTHGISKNNTKISLGVNDKSEIWNRKFKELPTNLQTEILSMTS